MTVPLGIVSHVTVTLYYMMAIFTSWGKEQDHWLFSEHIQLEAHGPNIEGLPQKHKF